MTINSGHRARHDYVVKSRTGGHLGRSDLRPLHDFQPIRIAAQRSPGETPTLAGPIDVISIWQLHGSLQNIIVYIYTLLTVGNFNDQLYSQINTNCAQDIVNYISFFFKLLE